MREGVRPRVNEAREFLEIAKDFNHSLGDVDKSINIPADVSWDDQTGQTGRCQLR